MLTMSTTSHNARSSRSACDRDVLRRTGPFRPSCMAPGLNIRPPILVGEPRPTHLGRPRFPPGSAEHEARSKMRPSVSIGSPLHGAGVTRASTYNHAGLAVVACRRATGFAVRAVSSPSGFQKSSGQPAPDPIRVDLGREVPYRRSESATCRRAPSSTASSAPPVVVAWPF